MNQYLDYIMEQLEKLMAIEKMCKINVRYVAVA